MYILFINKYTYTSVSIPHAVDHTTNLHLVHNKRPFSWTHCRPYHQRVTAWSDCTQAGKSFKLRCSQTTNLHLVRNNRPLRGSTVDHTISVLQPGRTVPSAARVSTCDALKRQIYTWSVTTDHYVDPL